MHERKKQDKHSYSGPDTLNFSLDIVEELRDMEDGEVTTTLHQAEELGFTELNRDELLKLHEYVFIFAKRNKIILEMTSDDDSAGGLPYESEYEVHNKKAQIKCPHCGSSNTCRILYGDPQISDRLKKKIKAKKIRISKRKEILSNIGGYTLDGLPHRYCNDCRKGFAKSPVLFNKRINSWELCMEQVQSIRFLIGGYFGGSTEILIEQVSYGAMVTIRKYPADFIEPEVLRITLRKWFRIVYDLYNRMYLQEWKREYIDPNVLDGEQWELEIKLSDDRTEYHCGSNAYPPYWPELKKLFSPYLKKAEKQMS